MLGVLILMIMADSQQAGIAWPVWILCLAVPGLYQLTKVIRKQLELSVTDFS